MYALNFARGSLLMSLCALSAGACGAASEDLLRPPPPVSDPSGGVGDHAGSEYQVDHYDPIVIDASLKLSEVIDSTLAKYPDSHWLTALEEEAKAIEQRSDSWFAGSASLGLAFQEATSGTLHYGDASIQVPLWNFGQRDAQKNLAQQSGASAQSQIGAVKWRVTGLVRTALWDLALQNIRLEQARAEVKVTDQLLTKVKKRYELGDLPRSDVLLAETELLQKKSLLTLAEAEVMHTRKRYISLTQSAKVPADFRETLSVMAAIEQNHPSLLAVNAQIERKQAELETIRQSGSGQTTVSVGINSDRGSNDPRSNNTESFNIGVSIPFGGHAHLAPQIAAANVELNKLIAEREQLFRDLERMHHEAEHALEVNRAELAIANELKQIAEDHLKMTQLSFSVGEINLMDLLKIQARTQQAALNAKERAVMLQRDIALYNQAVGVLP
ncbi:MAG: TolC family protein [Gammaproteobacteria bacterium]